MNLQDEIAWIIGLGVLIYYFLATSSKHTLLAILVMCLFSWAAYQYMQKRIATQQLKDRDMNTFLDREAANRKEVVTTHADIAKYPKKGFRYLKTNPELLEIVNQVKILRMFDRARFGDLLLHMDRMQKVYMYILDGRYAPRSHVPIFMDLRTTVQELLYSSYFVIPRDLKHVYGLSPYETLQKTITEFTILTRRMLETLRNYSRREVKDPYFPETLPQASDAPFDAMKARRLP